MVGPGTGSELAGGRYEVTSRIGRGGMAEVFAVRDARGGAARALKRLLPGEQRDDAAEVLFAREYKVLSEIEHPHVVRVHDYGVDDAGPYYVMDLVEGPTLAEGLEFTWKQTCARLLELCSALSVLHARKLAHCDVSPANVCLDAEGRAILIDFGAMMPFGPGSHTVGTAAFAAPELVHGQRVDGRTDVYGLGALAYLLLCGRHAYPARDFHDLRDLWRSRPRRPTLLRPELPSALDGLLSSMLSLHPEGRPGSVVEVMSRLQAIAELPTPGDAAATAFLHMPPLVGRDEARTSFRKRMIRAVRGRGGFLMVQGPAGSGRTRLLESHVLEGKLVGALVARAAGGDGDGAPLSTMAELLRQCQLGAPDVFDEMIQPYAALLGHMLDPVGYADPFEAAERADEQVVRTGMQRAIVQLVHEFGELMTLLLVVDDAELCDTTSLAVLEDIAATAEQGRVALVASAPADLVASSEGDPEAQRRNQAIGQLSELGARCALHPLTETQTRELLVSAFGGAAENVALSRWVYELSHGNPGRCLALARYLLDEGIVGFEEGAFRFPAHVEELSLPTRYEDALLAELRRLPPSAVHLCQLIAASDPMFPLRGAQLQALEASGIDAIAELETLRRAEVVSRRGDRFELRSPSLLRAADSLCTETQRAEIHRTLARVHEACGDPQVVIAHHHFRGGEEDEAFRRMGLIPADRGEGVSIDQTARFMRTQSGIDLLRFALDYALSHGRSLRRIHHYRSRLLRLSFADPSLLTHAEEVLSQLRRDTGLTHLSNLPTTLTPIERARTLLDRAKHDHEATPEAERCLSPVEGLIELAATTLALCASYVRTFHVEGLPLLRDMVAPFAPLSRAMGLVHDTTRACVIACVRGDDSRAVRKQLYDATTEPIDGLDDAARATAHLQLAFYLGVDEATVGSVHALEYAGRLRGAVGYASLEAQIRMLLALAQGEFDRAHEARLTRNLHAAREPHQQALALGPLWEAGLHYRVGDLLALRALLPALHEEAERYPGWQPWLHLVEAMYHALREDFELAEDAVAQGLSLTDAGRHGAWPQLMLLSIEVALGRGAHGHALERTEAMDEAVEAFGFALTDAAAFDAAAALSLAHAGDFDGAVARVERGLGTCRGRRSAGVPPSLLHEARARIALLQQDEVAFGAAARRLAAEFRPGQHPGLLHRYERLMVEAASMSAEVSEALSAEADLDAEEGLVTLPTLATNLQTLLGTCRGPGERAETALQMLMERTCTHLGYLFVWRGGDLELCAQLHPDLPDAALCDAARHLVLQAGALEEVDHPEAAEASAEAIVERGFHPFLLWSRRHGRAEVGGVAVLGGAGAAREMPWELQSALCDALVDAGDAVPLRGDGSTLT